MHNGKDERKRKVTDKRCTRTMHRVAHKNAREAHKDMRKVHNKSARMQHDAKYTIKGKKAHFC